MWTAQSEEFSGGLRFTISRDSQPASFANVIDAWQNDADFRTMFNGLLADAPYPAFRWETPAVTSGTSSRPFEFVLVNSTGLARQPDPKAFAEQFKAATSAVTAFPNLGRDAMMVVPCPVVDASVYGHLASFARSAPVDQQHELWRTVGIEMARRMNSKPVWLSTAGAGVPWLHVRLDDRPKYYCFAPYEEPPAQPL